MTCASCANRIERGSTGSTASRRSVNYATERASVDFDPAASRPAALVDAVEDAGYRATLPGAAGRRRAAPAERDPTAALRVRLLVSARR